MNLLKPHPELYNVAWTTEQFNGMPYRLLGKSGLKVSNVGLGTWKFGYPDTGDGSRVDEKTAFEIFDKAVELGVTHWDTANRYNNASGNSERIIGRWLRKNPDQRRNIVLATKIFGGMDGTTPNHSRLSRGNILDSVYASLQRLQLDYVDILYFHSFDPITPIEESLESVEDLVKRDLVRYFAVSNFSVKQLNLFRSIEKSKSLRTRILAVQNQFDLLNGESEQHSGVLQYCAQNGMSFIAWSPLARGLLTERYLDPSRAGKGDRLFDEGTLERDTGKELMKKLHKLAALSKELGISISQLSLAYMLTLPGMGPVIPSSSTVDQLKSNAEAGKIVLNEKQRERIKQALT
ncbi:MAG: aldo/keto reductase [Deltaproteobacteria bacterium]|nr:aldo/keto reductase [Deltaproteobacteria bacterium]MBW2152667.1 aldo/keto reductase [Deltaproteobacteria bacterium]